MGGLRQQGHQGATGQGVVINQDGIYMVQGEGRIWVNGQPVLTISSTPGSTVVTHATLALSQGDRVTSQGRYVLAGLLVTAEPPKMYAFPGDRRGEDD